MSEEFNEVTCCSCGIMFGFPKRVEEQWRRTGKTFHCPNGHPLVWSVDKDKETPEQKELKSLRVEVKELKAKLATALEDVATQKKKAEELSSELEIWRPTSAEPTTEQKTV